MSQSETEIRTEIEALWERYLDAVVNADLEAFSSYFSLSEYISHLGRGQMITDRDTYLAGIKMVFDAAHEAGAHGDPGALVDRNPLITVLSQDLVLVQFTCRLSQENVNYGISVIFKRHGETWKAIHTHDSIEAL